MSVEHSASPDSDGLKNDTICMSTASTTPDGSLTFSPVLEAIGLEDEVVIGDNTNETSAHHLLGNVCCVGAGYVGGPTTAILALNNPYVKFMVVDKDSSKIKRWNSRHLPIYEPRLSEIVRICRDGYKSFTFPKGSSLDSTSSIIAQHHDNIHIPARSSNLFFSDDIKTSLREADLIMIAVNTPTKTYGIGAGKGIDLTAVESVIQDIGKYAKPGVIIVEKSTVPCRTSSFIKDTLKIHRPNETFPILSNPEFLSAGTAVANLLYPDRILIGASRDNDRAAKNLASLYHWIPLSKIIYTSTSSSELAKLVSNAMLAQRISSINSISVICEYTGADIDEVSKAVGRDRRIGNEYLKAGIGFGGSCFAKDVKSLIYLAEGLGLEEVAMYWESVLIINEWQRKRWMKGIVGKMGGGLREKRIVVLGYAFKKGTGDMRESLARDVVEMLVDERPGEIVVWDDGCEIEVLRKELESFKNARVEGDLYTACEGADAVLVCRELERSSSNLQLMDPRPFTIYPSEVDVLDLKVFLSSKSDSDSVYRDSLGRLYPEQACEENCVKCEQREKTHSREQRSIDWKRIVTGMNAPRWIFDGRGVVDRAELEKIGKDIGAEIRIVGVGRQEW